MNRHIHIRGQDHGRLIVLEVLSFSYYALKRKNDFFELCLLRITRRCASIVVGRMHCGVGW